MKANVLDGSRIRMGRMVQVGNQLRRNHENSSYVAIHVEDADGGNERCLLFTEIELSDMEKVEIPFAFDNMKRGRVYPVSICRRRTFLVRIENRSGDEMVLRVSPGQLARAERRASRNPEDIPEKGFLADLVD